MIITNRYCQTCKTIENLLEGPTTVRKQKNGIVREYTHCRDCHNARQKRYRASTSGREIGIAIRKRQDKKYPDKYLARAAVNNAVKKGLIVKPTACTICRESNSRIEGHHFDYTKPLEVTWVCSKCHRSIHRSDIAQKAVIRLTKEREV